MTRRDSVTGLDENFVQCFYSGLHQIGRGIALEQLAEANRIHQLELRAQRGEIDFFFRERQKLEHAQQAADAARVAETEREAAEARQDAEARRD